MVKLVAVMLVGLLAGLLWMVWSIVEGKGIAHPLDTGCDTCHLVPEASLTTENAYQLLGSQERLCGGCHEHSIKASHPSGFEPDRDISSEFPLDWKGDLTCSTCHSVHGDKPGLVRVNERGKQFCLGCHGETFFTEMADQGQSLLVSGHLDVRTDFNGLGIDAFSMQCMSCHSDLADELGVSVDSGGVMRHASGSVNHPIGSVYGLRAAYGGYRDADSLPKEILLSEGKVGCLSCHQGYSEQHGELVLPNAGSALCYQCHDI